MHERSGGILCEMLLSRCLETLTPKYDLAEDELTLLYWLEKLDSPCDAETLCQMTGFGKPAVVLALARLLAKGQVRREASAGRGECFSFQAPQYRDELRQIDRDMGAVCFAGFTDEESRLYRSLQERINENILLRLRAETAE